MRKNIIIVIGIVFLTILSCKAQDKKTFKIKANWKKGEAKEMIVQQSSSWKMNGQETTFPTKISAKYLISIIDKTNKGYIVEWKNLNIDKELEENEIVKDYYSKFKYVIETDLTGNFKKLTNWKSLLELNKKLKDKIVAEAKKDNVNQFELEDIIAKNKLPETKNELIEMCKSLTDVFFVCYGEELTLNDTILEPITIPNQQFQEEIPALKKTITKELGDNKISIKYASEYDYNKLKELYEKHFPDKDYKEQKMNSYSEFIYNNKTGWIEKITFYNNIEDKESKHTMKIEYIIK